VLNSSPIFLIAINETKLFGLQSILNNGVGLNLSVRKLLLRTAISALVHLTADYCTPAWWHSAHNHLIDPVINNALWTVSGIWMPVSCTSRKPTCQILSQRNHIVSSTPCQGDICKYHKITKITTLRSLISLRSLILLRFPRVLWETLIYTICIHGRGVQILIFLSPDQSCFANFESISNPDLVPTRHKQSDSCLSLGKYNSCKQPATFFQ